MEAVRRGQGKAPGGGRWATGRLGLLGGELRAGGRGSVSGENVWLRSGSGLAPVKRGPPPGRPGQRAA